MSIISGASTSTAADLRRTNLSRALRAVHGARGRLTRAELGRELGCTRATVGALVADLTAMGLLAETVAAATGRRGRPTTALLPSADGPVVVAVEIATDAVRVASVGLGGHLGDVERAALRSGAVPHVVGVARDVLDRRLAVVGPRCAGVGIAVHGVVDRTTSAVFAAPGLGWADVEVDVVGLLGLAGARWAHIDNVAHLSAVAETVRGRARGVGTVLFLHAAVGVGGSLADRGRPLRGRRGLAGEYGHLPLGEQGLPCRCGGRGCWETEVDQVALARAAGLSATPATAAAAAADVLARARSGEPAARRAVERIAAGLGRGIGALVTVHDPDLVVLAGHGADVLAAAPQVVHDAARAATVPAHRGGPPPLVPSALGVDGGLVGAAEVVFDHLFDTLFDAVPPRTAAPSAAQPAEGAR
ncbi:ROK family transcriptional regulator [Kineococcus glutinatus]|uniref:ROK family transcriptional regulator n=1 Tax=Kineococcus glutinatus TaxID=1070872 RepID=A0ABP9I3N5_9ACTN